MDRSKLIEKINILGPWIHGYFDLGDGIIVQDRDILQQRRLIHYREYFIDIIRRHYGKKDLSNKTLCDIGSNAGYFLFELYKEFKFKLAVGFEPRATNRAKANFIAKYFKLPPNRYQTKKFDILNPGKVPPVFDIVLFPGVLYHTDNHLLVLENLYKMTGDLCIIETQVLPDTFNTEDVKQKLELKDAIYTGIDKNNFGVVGYKLEDNKLDGSTFHPGVVGTPTVKALEIMLRHVGFSEIQVYRNWQQLKKEIYHGHLHRDVYTAVIVAKKSPQASRPHVEYDRIARAEQTKEFEEIVPKEVIDPCYQFLTQGKSLRSLPLAARIICETQIEKLKNNDPAKQKQYKKLLASKSYYPVLETFKYAPDHKIPFEYAKTCFMRGGQEGAVEAKKILDGLCKVVNLDWRVVYKTYHLLSLISLKEGDKKKARTYNTRSLQTFPAYYLALDVREKHFNLRRK